MKTRYNTYDIVCTVTELQKYVGMRVHNVYDIDPRTYLLRMQRTGDDKCVLLLESGTRIHTTLFEWPKNMAPSGFSMKLRKHLRNKRLACVEQLGTDRIVALTFGAGVAQHHVILELYDRGNIILADYDYTILNVLRPHNEDGEDIVKFFVREKYPQDRARVSDGAITLEALHDLLVEAKVGDQLKKVLISRLEYGPAVIEHVLLKQGFTNATKIGKTFNIIEDIDRVLAAIHDAEQLFENARKNESFKGYIIQKREERIQTDQKNSVANNNYFYTNQEFHPFLFAQHATLPHKEYTTFNQAVDEFFSTVEGQKLEAKAFQQERDALKKLENVKKDHSQRLVALEKTQELDKQKAELITRNQILVDSAILAIQTALANQMSWSDIDELVKDATSRNDPIAKHITQLKLETNHISLYLSDPYATESNDDDGVDEIIIINTLPSLQVDIDLGMSAFANGRKYYDLKRTAAKKQQKTIESQSKAFKSAERKTKQTLKDVQTITNINKARKVYWFEKFFWFISSENYLIIGGRDQQQNEMIVKRYMKSNDVYVHADVHGASSVIIKNSSGLTVPPKTLNEAGTMAICYSVAWDAKVVTNAYWVWGEQVSKRAPTGEYLTTGSFMIRGKKNFLPLSHLILGLSFLFKLEDSCVERHRGERKIITTTTTTEGSNMDLQETDNKDEEEEEEEVVLDDDDDQNDDVIGSSSSIKLLDQIVEEEEKDQKISSVDEEENDDTNRFPDTHIKIQHFVAPQKGIKNILTTRSDINQSEANEDDDDEEEVVVFLGDDKPIVLKKKVRAGNNNNNNINNSSSKRRNNNEETLKEEQQSLKDHEDEETIGKQQQQQMISVKRGQKSKLKKIKEKYKDQDDEERQLRMDILQSAGTPKLTKKQKKKSKNKAPIIIKKDNNEVIPTLKQQQQLVPTMKKNGNHQNDDVGGCDDEDQDEEAPTAASVQESQAELDMIDTLTGQPTIDDELLFAVPVIAPYNTLTNYKFKVKLTPGTGRRGKAARTAVNMFLKDRTITAREKDLLKAVKDDQLARNLPGKVKLSAPKMQTLRR